MKRLVVLGLIVGWAAPVYAGELSCEELQKMHSIGLNQDAIVAVVQDAWLTKATFECLEEAELPPATIEAAALRIEEPKSPAPEVEEVAPGPIEEEKALEHIETTKSSVVTSTPQHTHKPHLLHPNCTPHAILLDTPHPASAALWSFGLGFGTGHFYAHSGPSGPGVAMLAAQAGLAAFTYGQTLSGDLKLVMMTFLGSVGLRLADAVWAGQAAKAVAKEKLSVCQ